MNETLEKRNEVISSILKKYDNSNYTSLSDIVAVDDNRDIDIISQVEKYLDENCTNGHFSRWTSFGNSLYMEAVEAQDEIDYLNFCK